MTQRCGFFVLILLACLILTGCGRNEVVSGIDNNNPANLDKTAPTVISNLAAINITYNSATLTWTAPYDANGVTQYEIRYSMEYISSANFGYVAKCASVPSPEAAGGQQSFTITGLIPKTQYYFAIKSRDAAGNWSVISNSTGALTLVADGTGETKGSVLVPTGVKALGGSGAVDISWEVGSDPNLFGFKIYRSTKSGGPYEIIGSVTQGRFYWDSGVKQFSVLSDYATGWEDINPVPPEHPAIISYDKGTGEMGFLALPGPVPLFPPESNVLRVIDFQGHILASESVFNPDLSVGTTKYYYHEERYYPIEKTDDTGPFTIIASAYTPYYFSCNYFHGYVIPGDNGQLVNGQSYYYVVTSLNKSGDESGYSSEVSAIPSTANPVSLWSFPVQIVDDGSTF